MSTHRPRQPTEHERVSSLKSLVRAASFSAFLGEAELERIEHDLHERNFISGGHVAWKGDVVEHWMVVVDGMVKVEAAAADGRKTTLIGITGGGWFGETALLRGGRWPFDVIASRATTLGLLPRATFECCWAAASASIVFCWTRSTRGFGNLCSAASTFAFAKPVSMWPIAWASCLTSGCTRAPGAGCRCRKTRWRTWPASHAPAPTVRCTSWSGWAC